MTGNTCCLCWDSSVCDPGWQCLPFPLCQNQTQLPNVSSASPQASCRCCPLSRSLGAAPTHPSFPSGLALPFVCFSQVLWNVCRALLFALEGTKLFQTLQVEILHWYFPLCWLDGGWPLGKGIIGKAGMTAGRGGVALVAVCSHLLKVLIQEPKFLEVCEWFWRGAERSGREIVLMCRN